MHRTEQKQIKPHDVPEVLAFSRTRIILVSALLAPGAGLAASLLSVLAMGILRVWAGIPTPVELFGDFYLKHINVHVFLQLLHNFSRSPKTGPLGLALLSMIALGTGLGLLYALLVRIQLPARDHRPERREWLTALGFTLAMTLIGVVLFWDELRQNFQGLPVDWARAMSVLGLLLVFAVYGATLCLSYRALLPTRPRPGMEKIAHSRRQWLTRGGIAALTVGAGAGTVGVINELLKGYTSYDGMRTSFTNNVVHPITPNNEHYAVTQNVVDPSPNIALWRFEVDGLINRAGSYTYDELQRLPSTSRAITLECISNNIGDHLIGNAIWHGVSLNSLLDLHGGPQSTASYVAFYSVDGYSISLPLKDVMEADALLAWRMNGAELPPQHGYPLRALVPGRYGEENPKWLTRVMLTDHFVSGLYVDQGWYNGPLHTISRIDRPRDTVPAGQPVEVSGIAFAGYRGIQQVEVSVDGGSTWHLATLDPPTSKDSWVFWRWQWTPLLKGNYVLTARATDGTGQVQTSQVQYTAPNGATGYHKVPIVVA